MAGLFDALTSQLSGPIMEQLGGQIGADRGATEKAVAAALPVLLSGLARNANKSSDDARSLASALERDHDGSILNDLGGLLTGSFGSPALPGKALDGSGILGHVLGGKRPVVEEGVAKASGLDANKVAQLLPMLAPIVMGALGKLKREQNLDAAGLAGALAGEKQQVGQRASGLAGSLIGLLDADKDGDVVDDLVASGGRGLLSKLFGRR